MYICAYNTTWSANGTRPRRQPTFGSTAVRFADAVTALEDERGITVRDPGEGEERWITTGMNDSARLLVVVFTWREERARIISARPATAREIRI